MSGTGAVRRPHTQAPHLGVSAQAEGIGKGPRVTGGWGGPGAGVGQEEKGWIAHSPAEL